MTSFVRFDLRKTESIGVSPKQAAALDSVTPEFCKDSVNLRLGNDNTTFVYTKLHTYKAE